MLPLPPFDLERPTTVEQVLPLLSGDARVLAGGTDLLPSMKQGLLEPARLVSLGRVAELQTIEDRGDTLVIGAGVRLRALVEHDSTPPALRAACRSVGTSTIQRMGTIGGNLMLDTRCRFYNQSRFWRGALGGTEDGCLKCDEDGICHVARGGTGCYAAHSADTAPVLHVLGAEVELASTRGARRVLVSELYGEDGRSWINKESDELLTRVFVPLGTPAAFRKLRARQAIDYALLLTAVSDTTIVISAVGPRPIEVPAPWQAFSERRVDELAEAAYRYVQPLSTHTWPATWRKKMVRVEVRRALRALWAP